MDKAPRGRGIIAGVMIFAALLILAYWVIWFLVDRDLLASLHTDFYYRFENAFPLADVWLGLLLILATVGLLLRRPWGLLAGTARRRRGHLPRLHGCALRPRKRRLSCLGGRRRQRRDHRDRHQHPDFHPRHRRHHLYLAASYVVSARGEGRIIAARHMRATACSLR